MRFFSLCVCVRCVCKRCRWSARLNEDDDELTQCQKTFGSVREQRELMSSGKDQIDRNRNAQVDNANKTYDAEEKCAALKELPPHSTGRWNQRRWKKK